jgi:hypothetical protein
VTQLCAITGCRIRGRHLPDCETESCGGCLPRIAHEGYTCDVCEGRAVDQLALIAELTPDARAVAAGLVRRGSGGGASGKPGSKPPLNDTATDALDEIQNRITTLAREIAETRGLQIVSAVGDGRGVPDPLIRACSWLSGQMRWVRHAIDDQGGAYSVEAYAEIADCARRIRGLVNGPTDQKYFGPCGGDRMHEDGCGAEMCFPDGYDELADVIECTCWCHGGEPGTCKGDTYGWPGAEQAACKTCGRQVSQAERRAYLDGEVRQHAYRAVQIDEAYGVDAGQIRVWAARGNLRSYWITEAGLTVEWTDPALDPALTGEELKTRLGEISDEIQARGPRVFYVGDVLDLAAAQAVRRAEAQAKRARRAATDAAEREAEAAAEAGEREAEAAA